MRETDSNRLSSGLPEGGGGSAATLPEGDRETGDVVLLPRGLPGFPGARGFRLKELPRCEGRFLLLELLLEEPVSLIVMPAEPGGVPLAEADVAEVREALEIAPEDLCLLLVVTLAREADGVQAYVNLRAPVFLDTRRRLAAQVVLPDPGYSLRHPLERRAA